MKRLAEPERDDTLGTSGAEAIRDEKLAGAKMRSEHRQLSGTGSGYSGKAARAARKGAEDTQKGNITR